MKYDNLIDEAKKCSLRQDKINNIAELYVNGCTSFSEFKVKASAIGMSHRDLYTCSFYYERKRHPILHKIHKIIMYGGIIVLGIIIDIYSALLNLPKQYWGMFFLLSLPLVGAIAAFKHFYIDWKLVSAIKWREE